MQGKVLLALFLCALVAPAMSDAVASNLMNILRDYQNIPSLNLPVSDHRISTEFRKLSDQPVPSKEAVEILKITNQIYQFNEPNFNRIFESHLYGKILTIRIMKKARVLFADNWQENQVFNSKVAVMMVENIQNKYYMRGVDGSGSMRVNKDQLDVIEIKEATEWLENSILQRAYSTARQATGLGASGLSALGISSKTKRQMAESSLLRRFYKKVTFSNTENIGTDLTNLAEFINTATDDSVRDKNVLNRMVQVSNSVGQANFIYVPRAGILAYITVKRTPSIQAEVRKYVVDGGLPEGAFIVSTGSWKVENNGRTGRVSVSDLMKEFKATN